MALNIGGKEFSEEQAQALFDLGLLGQKHDTSSATPSATPPHGPWPGNNTQFGIFSTPGVRPGMFNATPRVRSIGQYIPFYETVNYQELIDVATGVTVGTGTNQVSACVVGPKPGQLKNAQITSTFGIIHASTKIFDVTQAGMRRNRADVDREVYNQATFTNPWLPNVPGLDGAGAINTTLRAEMFTLGVMLERSVSQVHFLGVQGTEDNTYLGVARQWNGLDTLIKTGWTDAVSGSAVLALDASVSNFNAAIAGGTDVFSRGLVANIVDTYYGQVDKMRQLGIEPVYVLVMRPELFRAIAAVWACSYGTDRCYNATDAKPMIRSAEQVQRNYEEIMANMYLPLDGENIRVVVDDAIPRQTLGNNYYNSDVYGVMLSGNGIPTLYAEYFNMDNAEAMEIANFNGIADAAMTTINNGMYRVFKRVTGGCVEFDVFARVRLITNAPFSHFRIDNLFYRADQKLTDPIPGFSGYYNGGRTVNY
jgi:hypothetical protein